MIRRFEVCNFKLDELGAIIGGCSKCDWQGDLSKWYGGFVGYYSVERYTCLSDQPDKI
jgi:hypothetical protein